MPSIAGGAAVLLHWPCPGCASPPSWRTCAARRTGALTDHSSPHASRPAAPALGLLTLAVLAYSGKGPANWSLVAYSGGGGDAAECVGSTHKQETAPAAGARCILYAHEQPECLYLNGQVGPAGGACWPSACPRRRACGEPPRSCPSASLARRSCPPALL